MWRSQDGIWWSALGDKGGPKKQFARHGGANMRLLENAEWVDENFGRCELGHVKRTDRLGVIATRMLESPDSSLPQQNTEWSDLKAAYRLCNRPEVTFDSVASCHWDK